VTRLIIAVSFIFFVASFLLLLAWISPLGLFSILDSVVVEILPLTQRSWLHLNKIIS
jgi:hypothetical protein